MATYKTKGIIIKRKDFGEADRLITIFTDSEGKIRTKAKGVRWILSKNKGHLELFTYSDLILASGKEIDTLASAATLEGFKNIRDDLKKMALAYYFAELCDKLTAEKEKNRRVFDLLLQSFRHLDQDTHLGLLSRYFELNLLSALGYKPELKVCVHCRKELLPQDNFFSSKLGGITCPFCRKFDPKSLRISKDGLKVLRILFFLPLDTVLKLKIKEGVEKEVSRAVENFLRYIAEKEFKSTKFLKEIDELSKVA